MRARSLVFACVVLIFAAQAFAQWVVRPTGTTENLFGVAARGLQGATVVGSNATILYTEDDGFDWGPQEGEPGIDYRAVSFASHDTGLVAGTGGTILFTTDAGAEWQTIETGWMHPYYAAHQASPLVGAVGGINSVFQPIVGLSSDGWDTHDFHVFYPEHDSSFQEGTIRGVNFIDANQGFVAVEIWDGQGAICRTDNGGATWQTVYWSSVALFGIDSHGDEGFGVCAVGADGRIVTGGAGQQWSIRPSPTNQTLRGVAYDSQMDLCAVGDGGTIIRSDDGGESWELQESPTTENLNAVSFIWSNFATTDTGYIAGDNGVVLYTANGGGGTPPNNPPGEFVRVEPVDDDTLYDAVTVTFSWTQSVDPDGDAVTYILHVWSPAYMNFDETHVTPDTSQDVLIPWPTPIDVFYDFYWTVAATDDQDTVMASNGEGHIVLPITDAAGDPFIPHPSFLSLSAYPNPFNPATMLQVSLPAPSNATLRVFDVTGRLVRETSLGRLESGTHEIAFDGSALPSGIYLAAIETATARAAQKLVLMK